MRTSRRITLEEPTLSPVEEAYIEYSKKNNGSDTQKITKKGKKKKLKKKKISWSSKKVKKLPAGVIRKLLKSRARIRLPPPSQETGFQLRPLYRREEWGSEGTNVMNW